MIQVRSIPQRQQEFLGASGGWHRVDGEPADAGVAVGVGQRLEDRVAESALGPVVFGDDEVAGLARGLDARVSVSSGLTE